MIDLFEEIDWIDMMYAFGFVACIERLDIITTRTMDTNVTDESAINGTLIHYCYADRAFDKRRYQQRSVLEVSEEQLAVGFPGTINSEIFRQIGGLRSFLRPVTYGCLLSYILTIRLFPCEVCPHEVGLLSI